MKNMTAMVSCFSRAYHYLNNNTWVFKDDMARKLLTDKEYDLISENMSNGISFFSSEFKGDSEEALRFIVDNRLSPGVLARSAFCERMLDNAILLGCRQYAIFASGYDTFSLRNKCSELKVLELDLPEMVEDKKQRISTFDSEGNHSIFVECNLKNPNWTIKFENMGFERNKLIYGSLLGISFYLTKNEFFNLIKSISELWCEGSSICFDFPTKESGFESEINRKLAKEAGEDMKDKYSYSEIEKLLNDCGFLIYEYHDSISMREQYFKEYNLNAGDCKMKAPDGVGYILAVKK